MIGAFFGFTRDEVMRLSLREFDVYRGVYIEANKDEGSG